MLGNVGQHMTQVRFRINAVELYRANECVHGAGALAAAVGPHEQEVLPSQCHRAQCPFGGVVIDLCHILKTGNDSYRFKQRKGRPQRVEKVESIGR